MEKFIRLAPQACISLIVFLSLTACAPLGRVSLDVNQRQIIHQTNAIVSTDQKNLEVEPMDPPSTNYASAYGVTGILVAATINGIVTHNENKRTEKLFAPIHKHLINEDFNQQMNQQLAHELKTIKWLHFNESNVSSDISLAKKNMLINQAKGDAMVYVDLSYKLSKTTLDTLIVAADVAIYKKDTPRPTLIYQNKFQYFERLEPLPIKDTIKVWADNKATKTRQAMHTAFQYLSKAIAKDIENSKTKAEMNYPINIWYIDTQQGGADRMGYLEDKIGDKNIIRNRVGQLTIVNDRLVTKRI